MARWIKSDGTETFVFAVGKKWTLEELQEYVGGYIELMPGTAGLRMVMDEEGRIKGKPVNRMATVIVTNNLKGKTLSYQPTIYGDVLVLDKGERM